jgi:hypothetical protein
MAGTARWSRNGIEHDQNIGLHLKRRRNRLARGVGAKRWRDGLEPGGQLITPSETMTGVS